MKVNFGRRRVGESQESFVGSPIVLFFCINIEDLDERRDFFPVRFVKTYGKKNYLPVGEILVECSNVVLWIC